MPLTGYQKYVDLQRYAGWHSEDQAHVAEIRDVLLGKADQLIDDFYEEIPRHPEAAKVISGGPAQIQQLKTTLRQWLRLLLTGPYDHDYVVLRTKVGKRHVDIGLDQIYTNAAMSRLRSGMMRILFDHFKDSPADFAEKVLSLNKLIDLDLAIIEDAYQTEYLARQQSLGKENLQLRAALDRKEKPSNIVGSSEPMQEIFRLVERTGPTDKPILVQGESGTGKELVARALHRCSLLSDKPLVVINCAALPEALLESELFGHEKGAFTGAVTRKTGLFEVADGGTLFIDEIGELAGGLQAKLLRVLEDGTLRRVGSVKEQRVNVRLLAATNRDLAAEVAAGRFREDLYYRINVLTLQLPPLRDHREDIPLLLNHFAGSAWKWSEDFLRSLENYSWPGNVRQLRNAIERAKVLSTEDELLAENLPPEILRSSRATIQSPPGKEADLDSINRYHIADTYQRNNGNKTRTARALGISRRTLYRLIEKYDISEEKDAG